ncbi:MAG: hypothetical protein BWK76_27950 [Desulfobulbaceae bacterium A2]|nr:MAG: hypothetical protein BWK76_27950 [Desulfobulbaceae bacterium A2]
MIWHPLLQAILALDLLALLLLGLASWTAVQALLAWQPRSASARQLRLEARLEIASLQGRAVAILQMLALILLVVAIASALPPLVRGAMCGTGALNALGPEGPRLLLVRVFALLLLHGWRVLDGLNRQAPQGPLSLAVAKGLLLALPAVALIPPLTLEAFLALEPGRPVDCCAVVYDNFASLAQAGRLWGVDNSLWLAAMLAGAGLVLALALAAILRPAAMLARAWPLALSTCLWVPVAAIALVRVLAAYHYGVLHHHCPWCLFLDAQYHVGYPLWGSLLTLLLLGLTPLLLRGAVGVAPELRPAALRHLRRSAMLQFCLLLLFLTLATAPALLWRLKAGVWLG